MNWRTIGRIPYATWRAVLTSVAAPTELSGETCWKAAGGHSALCLAQILIESGGGRSSLATKAKNCLGQRPRPDDDGPTVPGPFRVFDSFAECIRYWYGKLTDPAYRYADTVTLEEYVHVYAPASDNNNEAEYVRDVTAYVGSWPREEGPDVPTITFGKVPHPPFVDRIIPSNINTAWDNLGKRTVRGIVWHRSQGSHNGNDTYFRGEGRTRALTDYGIGVAAIDGNLAGSIYRWNDPEGTRSPWANGKVSSPYGDGLAFLNRYGINAVGRDLTSVEISGFFPVPGQETRNTPLDEASRQAIAHLTAYWADQYEVSHETFPLIPSEGNRSFVIWHQEFTIGTGKTCPGPVVMDETPALIERARAVLKKYQTSGNGTPTTTTTTPPPAKPTYPKTPKPPTQDEIPYQGLPPVKIVRAEGTRWKCIQGTAFRTYPNRDAPEARQPARRGRIYTLTHETVVDGEAWLVTLSGAYALKHAFEKD